MTRTISPHHCGTSSIYRIALYCTILSCRVWLEKQQYVSCLCFVLQLTVIGRPRNNARVRMKVGEFYGRPLCCQSKLSAAEQGGNATHPCMTVLQSFYNDVHCRYSLTCSRLRSLLHAPKSGSSMPPTVGFENISEQEEETKVKKAYQQCIKLQLQLNLTHQAIRRLNSAQGVMESLEEEPSYDHYRVICHCLLDTLLVLTATSLSENNFLPKVMSIPQSQPWKEILILPMCRGLFKNLCVNGTPQLRERVSALLLRACGSQPWWGDFLASALKEFFSAKQEASFPREW